MKWRTRHRRSPDFMEISRAKPPLAFVVERIDKSFVVFSCRILQKIVYLSLINHPLIFKQMKRKNLKKHINYVCGELLAECIALVQYHKKENQHDIENVALGVIKMQNDLICRLSHVEPGSTRLFFKKLREDMQKRTEEIVDQLQNL